MITGIAHVNLTVPVGTLDQAEEFYGGTLGFTSIPVPALKKGSLAWFDITPGGQQIHIAFGANELKSSRHPCFKLDSPKGLLELQQRVWSHHVSGKSGAPAEADKPGEESSGSKGVEYPERFFARDYAGNRLEFSL
ncbi:Glyoxalase resistance protein dioxygenase [Venustampulla echinocandica]|uniref:Glyoxalase resistance protein dioxygenase n=1 Tax=Venustampulla echinocandica TaxID=2656787 RepID=A0A370U1L2_9HELO|nr:Glyoxalase resistance protein dioxygenase [Venustampulla echinocandica]RDL41633.1 Glyoxalase resistance protein dioxygenase [Venustampulla echinocandica]